MATIDELRLMAKVARLYYLEDTNQSKIARKLNLSQATVSRLLKKAQNNGIVRITVHAPAGVFSELESELEHTFGLNEALVVDCPNDADLLKSIGTAAAHYVETTINKGEVIGISSWSETLLAMVDALHPLSRSIDAQVVQILGGIGNPAAEEYAARLTDRLAKLLHGTATFLPAPGVTGTQDARDLLLQEQYVKQAVDLFDDITMALVGIGAIEPSKLLASSGNVFAAEELELLRQHGAVGDICLRFFDEDGQPVTVLDDRVIGMPLHQLREAQRVVGVAGGKRKSRAIRGALRGKLINVLVTDHETALALLEEDHLWEHDQS